MQETLLETGSQTFAEFSSDGVDGDKPDLFHGTFPSTPHCEVLRTIRALELHDMIIGLGMDVAEVERFNFSTAQLERFARKAFGHAIPWRQVGVRHERSGRPYVALSGGAERLTTLRGVSRMHLTISHSRSTAVATVILEADEAVSAPRPRAVGGSRAG